MKALIPLAFFRLNIFAVFLLTVLVTWRVAAQPVPSTNDTTGPLNTWSFQDTTNWTDDAGDSPISFTNLSVTNFGIGVGNALVVDNPDPAWLQFPVFDSKPDWTNITFDQGTIQFWFAGDWTSASLGGTGPGAPYGALIEAGTWTPEASAGLWSFGVNSNGDNLYFSTQDSQGDSTNYLTVPIAWTNGAYHLIALTYTATNCQLFINGTNAASGPGVTIYPSASILSNGFWIGSASNGIAQCHGAISALAAYNYPLDSNTIAGAFVLNSIFYNAEPQITQAPSQPEETPVFEPIAGPGYLITVSSNFGSPTSSNVWITNTTAVMADGAVAITFTIAGGDNEAYNVFATPAIAKPLTNGIWSWMGQGYRNCTYTIPGLTNAEVFLLLGNSLDSDGDGVPNCYELLISHTNPYSPDTYDGIPDAWLALEGISASDANFANEDPDGDGLLNYQEYLWGTNPTVSEGFAIWTAEPIGASAIP